MDSLINANSFSAANPSSYSLAEIWPFPINGGGGGGGGGGVGERSGGGLGLRMSNLSGFGEVASNRDISVDESTVTEQSASRGSGGGGRKRRDANLEDESSKLVSTSSGNDLNNTNGKRMKYLDPEMKAVSRNLKLKLIRGQGTSMLNKAQNHLSLLSRIISMSELEGVKQLIATVWQRGLGGKDQ